MSCDNLDFTDCDGVGAYGDVPIGAVLATMTHLSGAYSCSSTTAADERGFVLCNGQKIPTN